MSSVEQGGENINNDQDGNSDLLHICQQFDDTIEMVKSAQSVVDALQCNNDAYSDGRTKRLDEFLKANALDRA